MGVSPEVIGQKVKSIMNEMYQSMNRQFRTKTNFPSTEILQILLATVKVCVIMYQNVIKMENSLLFIFGEIWPKTMYYSTGTLTRFWSNF